MKLLTLYAEKNHFLKKFIEINDKETIQFQAGIFDGLELFYESREKLLEIIRYLDADIDAEQRLVLSVDPENKVILHNLLDQKNELVEQILKQDLEVINMIEVQKSHIIRELQDIKKNQRGLSGYKLNQSSVRLDEEA
jgi:hypothetical protein